MSNTLMEQAETLLKTQGGRMTSQRKLILEVLQNLPGHPTADEIYRAVSQFDDSLNLSTVYRNLRWLTEQELLTARVFNEDRRQERFDTSLGMPEEDHYHFLCQGCGQIFEFSAPEVEKFAAHYEKKSGAQVQSANLILYGLCANCLQRDLPAPTKAELKS